MEESTTPKDPSTHTKEGYEKLHRCWYCHTLFTLSDMREKTRCDVCGSRKFYESWLIKNDDEIAYLEANDYDYRANGFTIDREGNLPGSHPEYADQHDPRKDSP